MVSLPHSAIVETPTQLWKTTPDHETALSAVRNLQEVVVNGRNLRVELSTDEPYKPKNGPGPSGAGQAQGMAMGGPPLGMGRGFAPGQQQGQGFAPPGGFTPPQGMGMGGMNPGMGMGMGRPPPPLPPPMGMGMGMGMSGAPAPGQGVNMGMLPPGQDLPGGQKATDAISKTLASIPPGKLEEVLTGMKVRSSGLDDRYSGSSWLTDFPRRRSSRRRPNRHEQCSTPIRNSRTPCSRRCSS